MWFNNIAVYQYQFDEALSEAFLNQALEDHRLKPCPPHARQSVGWLSPLGQEHDVLLHSANGAHVLVLGKEERLLPMSVIKAAMQEKLQAFERQEQRPMKRAERLQLKEDLEFDLLPKAFKVLKNEWFYIDLTKQWIVLNTVSANRASDIIAQLRRAVGQFDAMPVQIDTDLSQLFGRWLSQGQALPSKLSLGNQCTLIDQENVQSSYQCKNVSLPNPEVTTLLSQGLSVSAIELQFDDRIQFTLTEDFSFKRVKCLDYLQESFHEHAQLEHVAEKLDADLALLSGELRQLIAYFLEVFAQPEHAVVASVNTKQPEVAL